MQTELVRHAKEGDREAFAVLAAGIVDRFYAVARLILRDADLAEDAAQDALVRAWRDLSTLRDVDRFDAWCYRLVVRACADIGRARRRIQADVPILEPVPIADRSAEVADRDELERGLRRLTDAQRTILVLHFYLDLPLRETAAALAIPIGTAKSRLHYALEALRAALEADSRLPAVTVEGRIA